MKIVTIKGLWLLHWCTKFHIDISSRLWVIGVWIIENRTHTHTCKHAHIHIQKMIFLDVFFVFHENIAFSMRKQKRPELVNKKSVVFHHDNARLQISLVTRQKMRELGWKVLMHPPYSPDLAPSDYYLFWSLKNSLNDVKLASKEACENHLV